MARSRGFTLLEMLVALAVFALLGLMTSQMVTRVIDVHNVAVERGERLGELQLAMQILLSIMCMCELHICLSTTGKLFHSTEATIDLLSINPKE